MTQSDRDAAFSKRPLSSGNVPAALFLSAFVDELMRLGVRDVVVSPGSRSTSLAMVFEASGMNLYLDVDERGAAFFALGLAKASRRPVCIMCTSGTAAANYMPAVCEADTSRIPLIVLTGDRPHESRNLGSPQTMDQLKLFGTMVRFFNEMPVPSDSPTSLAYARQMAREAVIHATGAFSGPVQLNVPLTDPLKADLSCSGLFTTARSALPETVVPLMDAHALLDSSQLSMLEQVFQGKRGIIVCGEGSYTPDILSFSHLSGFPLIADPLSNLRNFDDPFVIDNYDNIFGGPSCPEIDLVIRLGRWPISKRCFMSLEKIRPLQIVVDEVQTRDFNLSTDLFVRCAANDFVRSFLSMGGQRGKQGLFAPEGYAEQWVLINQHMAELIATVSHDPGSFEGPYVRRLLEIIPENSLLFSSASMSIRAIDTFFTKGGPAITVLSNRGLNGIDGTLSSALGAARCFEKATLLTGDLAFIHDISALHLQQEVMRKGGKSFVIVLSDNGGGGIFDTLPLKSTESYFERLFLAPQQVDYTQVASGFGIPFSCPSDVNEFSEAYEHALQTPGISLIDLKTPLDGLADCYRPYQICG